MSDSNSLSRSDLIGKVDTTWKHFVAALDRIAIDAWDSPGVCGWWSVGELVAHISYWESRVPEYIQRSRLGLTNPDPAATADYDAQNQEAGAQSRFEPNLMILRKLFMTHDQIEVALSRLEASIPSSLASEIACETWDHYPDHTVELERWSEALQTSGQRYLAIQEGMIAMAEALPSDQHLLPGITEEWSAKDLLGHLQFWDEFRILRLDLAAGRLSELPSIGDDVDEINARAAAERASWTWEETVANLRATGQKLAPMLTAEGEAAHLQPIHEHYLEHAPDLRNAVYDGLIEHSH